VSVVTRVNVKGVGKNSNLSLKNVVKGLWAKNNALWEREEGIILGLGARRGQGRCMKERRIGGRNITKREGSRRGKKKLTQG